MIELPPDAIPVSDDEIEDAPIDDDETTEEDDPAIVDEPPTLEEV